MRKRAVAALLAAVMVSGAFTGCGKTKERVNEEGESVITVWSPSDEPAIEEWWVDKIEEFNQAHEGEIELLAAAFALGFDYMFWREVEGNLAESMRVLICVLSGMWIALVIYVFPLAARMETDAGVTCRNGLLLLFKYLPQSVYLLFISGVFLAAALLWTPVFIVGVLAGGSLLAAVHGKMLMWIFEKEKIEIS